MTVLTPVNEQGPSLILPPETASIPEINPQRDGVRGLLFIFRRHRCS